jgi:tetratricopeptide (TPR) repeat protein
MRLMRCMVLCGLLILLAVLTGCGNNALELGLRAERAGNNQDALAAYTQACESMFMTSNKRARAYAGRAGILVEQGKFKQALADLDKALEQDRQSSAAYYNRAVLYILQGQNDKAVIDAKRVVDLDLTNTAAKSLLVYLEGPSKKFDLPLTWFKAHGEK